MTSGAVLDRSIERWSSYIVGSLCTSLSTQYILQATILSNETCFANAILGGGAPSSRRVADLALVCGRCWSHSKGSARHGVRWLSQVRYARPGRATGRRCDRGSAARRRAPARSSSTLAQVAGQRLDYVHPVERERHARMRRLVRDEQLRSGLGGTFEQAESWLWLVHAAIGACWRSRCACAAPNALPC